MTHEAKRVYVICFTGSVYVRNYTGSSKDAILKSITLE